MKLKTTIFKAIGKHFLTNLRIQKTACFVMLFCGLIFTSKGQSHVHEHEDSIVILENNTFSIVINHTLDGLLQFELVNNLASEISPFFMETILNGYNFNETHIEQSLNNTSFTENIERVFGPQYMSLGIPSLPAFGNYKTTFTTENKTNEASTVLIRIYGTLNGQSVVWSRAFNF